VAGRGILPKACPLGSEAVAGHPFAFTVADAPNRLAAGGGTEVRPVADRRQGWFIAAWPVAQNEGQKNCCCVTTRRHNLRVLRWLRRRLGTLTARPLRLGLLDFGGRVLTSSGLAACGLPAAHLPSAFGVLAVALVPSPWQVGVATAFAQAQTRSQATRPFPVAIRWITMRAAHGSVVLPRDSPGGTCPRSPRALLQTGTSRTGSIYAATKEPDREGNSWRKAERRRQGRTR